MHSRIFFLVVLLAAAFALAGLWMERRGCLDCFARHLMFDSLRLPYPEPPEPEKWSALTAVERLADTRARLLPGLHDELAMRGTSPGAQAYLRAFKESRELELWLRDGSEWVLFRNYPVAALSGGPGPKQREGDGQVPEGFYAVERGALNPASSFHLSFNIGYPNAHDRHLGRTGSFIMVHGSNVSIGCLAMTDPVIEEIYLIVEAALDAGQRAVPVHVFPFRMTDARMELARESEWHSFWSELRAAHDAFEQTGKPPRVVFDAGRQVITPER